MVHRPFRPVRPVRPSRRGPSGVLRAAGALALAAVLAPALGVLAPMTTAPPAAAAGGSVWTNLLTGDQSGFTSSTGGWTSSDATLTWDGGAGHDAPGSLLMTARGSGGMTAVSGPGLGTGAVAAQAGAVYRGSTWAMDPSGSQSVAADLDFYNAAGGLLSSAVPGPLTTIGGGWEQLEQVVAIAPAGTAAVALGVSVSSGPAGQQMLIDDAFLGVIPSGSSPVQGPLRVAGNHIFQADGQPFVMRGFNFYGLQQTDSPANFSEAEFAEMRSWGANTVRIAVGEQLWLTDSCNYDSRYESAVDDAVNWTTSLGMMAVIDLHWNQPWDLGASPLDCPAGSPQVAADNPGSIDFWQQVAARYGSNPLVAFDLYNEPHNVTFAQWLTGGPVNQTTSTFPAAGMQQLYDAVRGTGAQNLVIATGLQWGNEPPSLLISGDNVAYGVHAYTCPGLPPPNCTNPSPDDPSVFLKPWIDLGLRVPLLLMEFGFPSRDDEPYNANAIAGAESLGWAGWSVFSWDGTDSGQFDLLDTTPGSGTAEPAPAGMAPLCAMTLGSPDTSAANDEWLVCGGTPEPGVGSGYDMTGSDGGIFSFGSAPFLGSTGGMRLNRPVVGMASDVDGIGYWLVASDGGVFAFGLAPFEGSTGAMHLNSPIVGMALDPATGGYWLVAADGGIFSFGAPFFGSTGALRLDSPVVGMAATPDGGGYWLVAADGGVFSFGDATFEGSMGGIPLRQPVVGMAADPFGGYWLVAADGGVFSFGGAPFYGSTGNLSLVRPVVGISSTPDGGGYWMVASDGGVFSFGDAPFLGSMGGRPLNAPVVGISPAQSG